MVLVGLCKRTEFQPGLGEKNNCRPEEAINPNETVNYLAFRSQNQNSLDKYIQNLIKIVVTWADWGPSTTCRRAVWPSWWRHTQVCLPACSRRVLGTGSIPLTSKEAGEDQDEKQTSLIPPPFLTTLQETWWGWKGRLHFSLVTWLWASMVTFLYQFPFIKWRRLG